MKQSIQLHLKGKYLRIQWIFHVPYVEILSKDENVAGHRPDTIQNARKGTEMLKQFRGKSCYEKKTNEAETPMIEPSTTPWKSAKDELAEVKQEIVMRNTKEVHADKQVEDADEQAELQQEGKRLSEEIWRGRRTSRKDGRDKKLV